MPRRRSARLLLVALLALSGCGWDHGSDGAFVAARPDRLTVATAFLPSAGFWEGPADEPTGGLELALAEALAARFDLDAVEVVPVGFDDLVGGDLGGADLAISQLTPTSERDRDLDFSTPYLEAPPGVVVRAGERPRDVQDLQRLRWVVVASSTLTAVLEEHVRPDDSPVVVDERSEALAAIADGRADAMLLDLPVALALADESPTEFAVAAQLPESEGLAIALADGSPNLEAVDTAVRALRADGTIEDLAATWLGAADGDEIPLIRTAG